MKKFKKTKLKRKFITKPLDEIDLSKAIVIKKPNQFYKNADVILIPENNEPLPKTFP